MREEREMDSSTVEHFAALCDLNIKSLWIDLHIFGDYLNDVVFDQFHCLRRTI